MKKKKFGLMILGGLFALGAFVIDSLKYESDREEDKEEIKQELLAELREEN